MKLVVLLACLLSFGFAARAQQATPEMNVDVKTFRYPTLAAAARIRGDVSFEVTSERKLVADVKILGKTAETNLATWTLPPLDSGKYLVTYHFELVDLEMRQETVLIGNKFDRFFLPLFGTPTKKIVKNCYSDPTPEPPTSYTVRKERSDFLIDVYVTGHVPCIMTNPSTVARGYRIKPLKSPA